MVSTLLALPIGCGGDNGPAFETVTELQIVTWPKGRRPNPLARVLGERRSPVGRSYIKTLRCDPAGGDLPDAKEACERLADMDFPFAETPDDAICAERFDGPQFAVVQGVWRGETVNARFERNNSCEIARWNKLAFLFTFPK